MKNFRVVHRLKRRLRQGARLIVADPRRIDLVKSPHVHADHHLPLRPGTNVAFINAMAHVIVSELVPSAMSRGGSTSVTRAA